MFDCLATIASLTSKKTAGPDTPPKQSRYPSAAAGYIRHCCAMGTQARRTQIERRSERDRETDVELAALLLGSPCTSQTSEPVPRAPDCVACNTNATRCAPRPEGRPLGVGRRSPSNYRRTNWSWKRGRWPDPFSGRHPICRSPERKSTPHNAVNAVDLLRVRPGNSRCGLE